MTTEDAQMVPAPLGPVERQVRRHAPVAEVVCYETPRHGKPPMQIYELRQFDGFRKLPPGTHQLYTEDELKAALSAQRDAEALEMSHGEVIERLRAALRVAVRQNEHDMLMTGEECRACRAALAGLGDER